MSPQTGVHIVVLDRDTTSMPALVQALTMGQVAGAGIDVVSREPMLNDHPLQSLMGRNDFILTPHVAWASREATQNVSTQVTENIEAFLAGAPRNIVHAA